MSDDSSDDDLDGEQELDDDPYLSTSYLDEDATDDEHGDVEDETHPRFQARQAEVADQTRKRRNRKRLILLGLVTLILLAAGSTQTRLFDVDEIRVVGAENIDPDVIRAETGIELGQPVLGLDTDDVERQLRFLPAVRGVSAEVGWDGVLTVDILERLPVARMNTAEGTLVVAVDGMVLDFFPGEIVEPGEFDVTPPEGSEPELAMPELPADVEALPQISGAIFVREVGELTPRVLDDALEVAEAIPVDIQRVTERIEIAVNPPDDALPELSLRTVGGGRILVGDSRNLEEKFAAIRAFLAQVDLSCLDVLNVQAPTVPVIRRNPSCAEG